MLNTLMNKMMVVAMAGVMLGLGGCAGVGPMTTSNIENAHKLAKDNSGIVYGAWMSPDDLYAGGVTVKSACDTINNNDERCNHQEDYKMGFVVVDVGFNAGLADVFTLMPKSMDVNFCKKPGSSCTFLKVHAVNGKLGEVIEIASVPGDDKCHWSGMPGIGGTSCPAYNWDSRKDLHSYDTTLQKMTVSDN